MSPHPKTKDGISEDRLQKVIHYLGVTHALGRQLRFEVRELLGDFAVFFAVAVDGADGV